MVLLDWMHRKFRQCSRDVLKDCTYGVSCICRCNQPPPDDELRRGRRHPNSGFSSTNLILAAAEEDFLTISAAASDTGVGDPAAAELFTGLLAIGTLGILPVSICEEEYISYTDGTATTDFGPRAPALVDAIAEKAAEATTETDLMVVTVELEKVLAAEAEKDSGGAPGERLSSARPSGAAACPLQGFLFGSPIETAETAPACKEKRVSLGELFMRSRIAEDRGRRAAGAMANGSIIRGGGREAGGVSTSSVAHLLKMLKLRRSKAGGSGGGANASAAAETKLQKILQIFHRKVYPDSAAARKPKNRRHGSKECGPDHDNNKGPGRGGPDRVTTSRLTTRKERMPNFNCCSSHALLALENNSSGNREHWIKTDADYLVLEL